MFGGGEDAGRLENRGHGFRGAVLTDVSPEPTFYQPSRCELHVTISRLPMPPSMHRCPVGPAGQSQYRIVALSLLLVRELVRRSTSLDKVP